MKSTSVLRTIALAKLATKVGLKELASSGFRSRMDQAKIIADSLADLKGAAMKAGQLLSLDLDGFFPPEAVDILSKLQNAATAQPTVEIEKVLSDELAPEARSQISELSRTPIGVASIGQVHKARYKDRDIVLKVQYEGVRTAIDSDLKILKTLALSICQLTGRKMNLEPLFAEFRSVLVQETDYCLELKFQNLVAQKIADLSSSTNFCYVVPKTIEEISSERVLSMNFQPGLTLRSWLSQRPGVRERNLVARAVLDLYFYEFFKWGLVQTDPNWGNFLVQQEGDRVSLCLLDFGATRSYSKEFRERYLMLLKSIESGQRSRIRQLSIDFGLIDARESEATFEVFEHMLEVSIRPFFVPQADGECLFDFTQPAYLAETQAAAIQLSRLLVYSPPPYPILFLHRKLAGVFSILKSLEAKIDVSKYWEAMPELISKGD